MGSYFAADMEPFAAVLAEATEVCFNADGRVWIERRGGGGMVESTIAPLSLKRLRELAEVVAGEAKAKLGKDRPLVSGSVDFENQRVRVQVVGEPAISDGAALSLRLFRGGDVQEPSLLFGTFVSARERRQRLIDSIKTLLNNDLHEGLRQMVRNKLNIVVSGGTSSGKTSLLRWFLGQIEQTDRLVLIEDAPELYPAQPNVVGLLADRSEGSVRSPALLLEASLRLRPDRIILGELRGEEALAFAEAINTGHGGSMTTVHAETAELALDRLAILMMRGRLQFRFDEVRAYLARTVDVIVQVEREGGKRGITEIFWLNQS